MWLKNYMKEGQKLPLFGVGPYLIYGIGLFTALCIVLFVYIFKIGNLTGQWVWVFRTTGAYRAKDVHKPGGRGSFFNYPEISDSSN